MGSWVLLNKLAPRKDKSYLVATEDEDFPILIAQFDIMHHKFDCERFGDYIVTHWQPLPDPPQSLTPNEPELANERAWYCNCNGEDCQCESPPF